MNLHFFLVNNVYSNFSHNCLLIFDPLSFPIQALKCKILSLGYFYKRVVQLVINGIRIIRTRKKKFVWYF